MPSPELRELAVACSNELDGYSRFLGRNPDQRLAPEALNLLPTELLTELEDNSPTKLIAWLTETVGDKDIVTIEFTELEAQWPEIHERYAKRDAISLAACLERMGYGMEPDLRSFGSYAGFLEGKLILFKLISSRPESPSPGIDNALVTVRLGAMVLRAEGLGDGTTEEHFVDSLCNAFHLGAPERQRLRGRLRWLIVSKSTSVCNKSHIGKLDLCQRTAIGQLLTRAAGASVSAAGVKALEKAYHLLGLETEKLYSDMQRSSTMPVTVQSSDSGGGGFAIPPPPDSGAQDKDQLEIDMTKVSAIQAETQQVSELLRDIFVRDDGALAANDRLPPVQGSILGLSLAQSAFLRVVVSKPSWTRAELEAIASDHQILLDGAIDAINEKTLDKFSEPLLEGNERIDVNSAALKEIAL